MSFQSELLSPITHVSGEGSGRVEPEGQVMAADGDDDMEWLDVEKIQYRESDEDKAEYEFPELGMGFDLTLSERAAVAVDGEVVPQHHQEPRATVRGLARPLSLTKTQCRQHYLEGHANYRP